MPLRRQKVQVTWIRFAAAFALGQAVTLACSAAFLRADLAFFLSIPWLVTLVTAFAARLCGRAAPRLAASLRLSALLHATPAVNCLTLALASAEQEAARQQKGRAA